MPFYPSSATGGTSRGGFDVNNITNYQELKDTVVGYGSGTGDTTLAQFNSAAKYPTDVNIGGPNRSTMPGATGAAVGSSSIRDLELAIANFVAAGVAFTAESFGMSAVELKQAPGFSVLSFENVQRKLEMVTFELNRLAADMVRVNAGTAGGFGATGRYPSSWNRTNNVAGGG